MIAVVSMTFDPRSLLPASEMVRARSPRALHAWVLETCDAIAKVPEAKRAALLHHGPFKKFYEEIFPFSIFAIRCYGDRNDVLCVPNRDEQRDFDAEVRDPLRRLPVEITLARDPKWHYRMAYLLEQGGVSMWGPMAVDSSELRECHLRLVKEAAEGKAGPGRYGRGYELEIAVEDSWFDVDRDSAAVADFLEQEIVTLPLCFGVVHLIGLTDRLYKSVAILR
jgi:hypothetical protein